MTASTSDPPRLLGRTGPGLVLAAVSATTFGLSGALARGLLETGWSAGAAVTVRTALAAIVLLVPGLMALRGRWSLLRSNLGLIVLYGVVAVAGTQLAFFYAVQHMQVGIALLIEYTAPVAVVTWTWLRHGHRPTRLVLVGAVVSAAGMVLLLDLLSGTDLSTEGVVWALGAMLGAATYFVLSADDAGGLPPISLAAGGLAAGSVVLLLAGALQVVPMSFSTADAVYDARAVAWWVPVLGLGLVTAAVAYVTGIEASRRLGSRLASFVALLEVVLALFFAWLLLGELPRPVQLLGGLVVLAGVVVVKLGEGPHPTLVEPLPEAVEGR